MRPLLFVDFYQHIVFMESDVCSVKLTDFCVVFPVANRQQTLVGSDCALLRGVSCRKSSANVSGKRLRTRASSCMRLQEAAEQVVN